MALLPFRVESARQQQATCMNIFLIHHNFPAQFRHLAPILAAAGHRVVALTVNAPGASLPGVRIVRYEDRLVAHARRQRNTTPDDWQSKVIRGTAEADAMQALRDEGFAPDVVFAHPGWGEALFVRTVFPSARLLVYAEYFYGSAGGDVGFDPEFSASTLEGLQRLILKNTHLLHALNSCAAALAPTAFWAISAWAELCATAVQQVSEWSGLSNGCFKEQAIVRWPGPEILAIKLIAENQPFDSTSHEKFRCNCHGRLMAASSQSRGQVGRRKPAIQQCLNRKIPTTRPMAGHGPECVKTPHDIMRLSCLLSGRHEAFHRR